MQSFPFFLFAFRRNQPLRGRYARSYFGGLYRSLAFFLHFFPVTVFRFFSFFALFVVCRCKLCEFIAKLCTMTGQKCIIYRGFYPDGSRVFYKRNSQFCAALCFTLCLVCEILFYEALWSFERLLNCRGSLLCRNRRCMFFLCLGISHIFRVRYIIVTVYGKKLLSKQIFNFNSNHGRILHDASTQT